MVQYVIEMGKKQVNARVADKLAGSIIELSNEKFSSNVIEKVSGQANKSSALTIICRKRRHR